MEEADETFDISRVTWEQGKFQPWHISSEPVPLRTLSIEDGEELLVGEIGDQPLGFLLREVTYHHVVQGIWQGSPFMITFCGVCNAGVVTSPVIDGRTHRFREIGVYNGQMIFADDESGTLWNHLTGEALHGPLIDKSLPVSMLTFRTAAQARAANPDLLIFQSGRHRLMQRVMRFVIRRILGAGGRQWLPPHFARTLPETIDNRLPRMTMGLAVIVDKAAIFYPMSAVEAGHTGRIGERTLHLAREGPYPVATWPNGSRPFQLITRWYAFTLTYPHGQLEAPE
ncbi:MAG: DUF3179 domain-containing protein [Proteobacteria bacterium]|jgi:hypothetical protein|nr:DUF3179 domain-containing protein [Pseudomonadota bacterium]